MTLTRHRREVIVVGGGQAGLAIGYLLARAGPAVHDPGSGRHAGGGVARALGLAAAVHPGPLRQPAGPRVPRRSGRLPGPRRRRRLPHRLRARLRAAGRAEQPCPRRPPRRARLPRRARRSHLRGRPGRDRHRPVPDPARAGDRRAPGPGHLQFHSSEYRAPQDVPAGPVLVVGGGNTGYQIAEELARTHEVHLSIGARQTPLPQRILGRDLFRYLEATGLMGKTVESRIGQRMQAPRDADRLKPPRRPTPARHRAARANRRRVRLRGALQRRRPAAVRARSSGRPASSSTTRSCTLPVFDADGRRRAPARRHRIARAVLPRHAVAAHARLGAAGLGQGRRPAHRPPHLRDPRASTLDIRHHCLIS